MDVELSIIIVSWNVREDVLRCLQSIDRYAPATGFEVIVVDNASEDGTAESIAGQYPHVRLMANGENVGLACANNIGLAEAGGRYVLFLNPDTLVTEGSLDKLVAYMGATEDVGICGPQIIDENDGVEPSVRHFPTFRAIFHRFTLLRYFGVFRKDFHRWLMRGFDPGGTCDVEQIIGAAMIARRQLLDELGGFDTRFFMYYEEVDLCKRIQAAGRRCVFFSEAGIVHLGGRSTRQIPAKARLMMLSSLVLYMRKHHRGLGNRTLIFCFKLGVFVRQVVELLVYLTAALFSLHNPGRRSKNVSRIRRSREFLVRYYIRLLTC